MIPPYIPLADFKKRYFGDGKHPSLATLRRLAAKNVLPNRPLGKLYYIDWIAFEANGNKILEKALRDVSRTT